MDKHAQPFYQKMLSLGHSITFDFVPDRKHCDLSYAAKMQYARYALDAITKANGQPSAEQDLRFLSL